MNLSLSPEEKVVDITFLDYRKLEMGSRFLILSDAQAGANVIKKILKSTNITRETFYSLHKEEWPEKECCSTVDTKTLKDIYLRQGMHMVPPGEQADDHLHFLPSSIFEDNLPADLFSLINKYTIIPEAQCTWHHIILPHNKDWYKSVWYKRLLQAPKSYKLWRLFSCTPNCTVPPSILQCFDYLILFPTPDMETKKLWKLFATETITNEKQFKGFIESLRPKEGLVKHQDKLYLTTSIVKH